MKLEEKLVILRKEKSLSQMKVAEELGVSRQAISRWEVGVVMPSTDNLKCLGELYGVPVDALLNDNIELPLQKEEGPDGVETKPSIRRTVKFAIALLLILVIAIIACIGVIRYREEIVPIEELEGDADWESAKSNEFSVDW